MKRRRTDTGYVVPVRRQLKRPIDKELISIAQTSTNSVVASTLKTTTFPCTVTGIRWSMSCLSNTSTANPHVYWAIILVQDGEAANTPAVSDGSDFYTPEQNVLAFGMCSLSDADSGAGNVQYNFDGSTKTMRKLKQGDLLQFITLCDTASGAITKGVIQFFYKS